MTSWRDKAQCAGDNPRRYTLDEKGEFFVVSVERQMRAWELCQGCPVKAECAEDALIGKDVGVVRAGTWIPCGRRQPTAARQALLNIARSY